MEQGVRACTRDDYRARMLRVLVHIQNHLDETLGLDDLAAVAHFSPFHFHRVFRGMIGESVQQHVRRLRLERAAHRLKFSREPVTRVAFEAGYQTHEAFTRAFRAMFAASPSDFRREHQSLPLPQVASGVHFASDGKVGGFTLSTEDAPILIRVQPIEPMRVAFIRHTGPYDEVGPVWNALFNWAGRRKLMGAMMAPFAVAYDDPAVTPVDKLRYDACMLVGDDVQPEGEIGVQTVAGGEFAVGRHIGPYDRLGESYDHLCGRWLPGSGRELRSAPALEFYRNSPFGTPPEKLITDICLPLEDET